MPYYNGVNFIKDFSNGFIWYFEFSSKIFIDDMCVVALVPAIVTINDSIVHPLLAMVSIND